MWVDRFIAELCQDEFTAQLYQEIQKINERDPTSEPVDDYIERVIRRKYARRIAVRQAVRQALQGKNHEATRILRSL